MEDRIKEIICNEYNLNIEKLNIMEGGYRSDETYYLVTIDQSKYVVKYIEYSDSIEHLELILKFENILHDIYKYPCPKIILSKKEEFIINDKNRFLFIETFIEGIQPTKDILDKDKVYLYEMGCLLAQWRIASREYSFDLPRKNEKLIERLCEKQNIDMNIDPFLLFNFVQCKEYLINLNENFEYGLIHNDFHPNNSLMTKDGNIYIIDFVDACQSLFISDLSTSIFHLLIDQQNGIYRTNIFLQGYQQFIKLTLEEINVLDIFVRFNLTLSIIEDLRHSSNINHPFIQSCFHLLHTLNNNSNFIKNLLK